MYALYYLIIQILNMESSCIQVWARMRPLTQQEAEEEENHYLQLGDSKTLVNIQSKDSWSYGKYIYITIYGLDNIFTEDAKNKEIFNSAAEGSVKSAISGINSTLYIYIYRYNICIRADIIGEDVHNARHRRGARINSSSHQESVPVCGRGEGKGIYSQDLIFGAI